jgi:hypothetical protein
MTQRFVTAPPRSWPRRLGKVLLAVGVVYVALAYVILPWAWTHHERQRGLASLPMVTRTAQGIPGDPLNVGLVGTREDVVLAMRAAGWSPADPITLKTSLEIAGSVLLDRPYRDAPVSALYYEGRRQDLAYEQEVGSSADHRHHVRLWLILEKGQEGAPVWLGSATFDRGSGLSHYTGAITHHIAPDLDAERRLLVADLVRAGMVASTYSVTGIGPTLLGRNGEGDPYYTDGEIAVAVLVPKGERRAEPPVALASPPLVALKDDVWRDAAGILSPAPPEPEKN